MWQKGWKHLTQIFSQIYMFKFNLMGIKYSYKRLYTFYLFQSQNTILDMLSASIKLTNLHYFEALQQLALANLNQPHPKSKLIQIPFYNFVCTFIDILTQFSKTQNSNQHSEFQILNLNSFLVDYYKILSQPNLDIPPAFQFFKVMEKQAKLFLSLMTAQRNSVGAIKSFLKLRKCILKTLSQKILQQISLTHEDTLAITHSLFSQNPQVKSFVTKKINELFISLKRKLINIAKVNGAVMCQFFIACSQKFSQLNVNNLFKETKNTKKKLIPSFSAMKNKSYSPLKQIERNCLYAPESSDKYNDIKYNLSFSEQFASYYSPQPEQTFQNDILLRPKESQSNFLSDYEQPQKQWKIKQSDQQAPINLVRNSLTIFKQKDKQIDQKLNNCRRTHFQQQKRYQLHSKQNMSYPEGWDNFIKTNQITKKKLMAKQKL